MKKQDSLALAFGADVVDVRASDFSLPKSADVYTNLTLSADIPKPLSFSKTQGLTWSREFRKPEIAPDLLGDSNSELLFRLTQLRSFSIDGVSLIGCESPEKAKLLGTAFESMKSLKSLKVKRAFTAERSVPQNKVPEVNLAIQHFCHFTLSAAVNLVEFESHYNQLSLWSEKTWKAWGDAFRALTKITRVSIKETAFNYESCAKLTGFLTPIVTLESFELKVLNSEKVHWASIAEYLESNKNLRVLEVGMFDLNNDPQKEMLEKIWLHSVNIQTFGLSLINFNAPSVVRLFKMLLEEKYENFSRLILDVDTLKDAEHIEIHVNELLNKTSVIDVRIFVNNEDVTPDGIRVSCAKKRMQIKENIEGSLNEEAHATVAISFQNFVNKLAFYPSSVLVVGDQLDLLFECYNYLKWLDESPDKSKKIDKFYQFFILCVELGWLTVDYMTQMLEGNWSQDEIDIFLSLLPVFNSVYFGKEISAKVVDTFRSVTSKKSCELQEKCRKVRKAEVTEIFEELSAFLCVIEDYAARGFINELDRQDYTLFLNHLKSQLSKSLTERVDYFKICVEDQLSHILKRGDLSAFTYWFRVFSNLMTHELLGNEEEIYHVVLSSIKNPEFLAWSAFIIEELRQPKNENSEIFPSVQMKLLSKSLPILLVAKRKGFQDKEKKFEFLLKKYLGLSFGKNRGSTNDAIDAALMAEVEQMAKALFIPELKVVATKEEETLSVKRTSSPAKNLDLVPLRHLLRNQSSETYMLPVSLKELIRDSNVSHDKPLGLYLRSSQRTINVLVNNGSPNETTQQLQLTENALFGYLQKNNAICVLELGSFDFNNVIDSDYVRYCLKICTSLRSFGLKLNHFNQRSADQFLELMRGLKFDGLSQCVLRVDSVDNVQIERVIDWLLVNTSILDLRIFCGNREIKFDEIQGRCQEKIKLLMNPINSDKGKIENKEFERLSHDLSSRLCEELSSVSIVDHHVLTSFQMCIELDKSSVTKTNEELDKFIVKMRRWVESEKVRPVAVLRVIELLRDKHLNTQVMELIGMAANRCDKQQIETTLQPVYKEIIAPRFEELRKCGEQIFNLEKNSPEFRQFLKEFSSFIDLINDVKYSALMVGQFADWKDYMALIIHYYKDALFVCQGNIKRFVKECASVQAKHISDSNLEVFEGWFRHLATIIRDDRVIDDKYLIVILRSFFANVQNIEQLLKASDVIAESHALARSLKISLALLHQAVMKGYEDQEGKFQVRLDAYMKASGIKVVETNQVLSEIDALANDLFIEQQAGNQFLYAYLPGKKEAVMFTEEKVLGEGDCGFITIGASRDEVADVLLLCINDQSVCEQLWEEVYEAFLTNNLVPTPEFLKLYDAYQKPDANEKTREKIRQKLVQYCQKEKVIKLYIEAYRHNLWLGFKSALLFAKLTDMTLYVWAKAEDSQQLILKGSNISAKPERVIHMLLTSGFIHFNLLVEMPMAVSNYHRNHEPLSIQEFLSQEGKENSWGDGIADHQSAEDDMSSSFEDQRPSLSTANNRNRFKLAPLPENRPTLGAVKKI